MSSITDQIILNWPINIDGSMGLEVQETYQMEVPSTFEHRREMCHFELKGQMYMIGGTNYESQSTLWRTKRQYRVNGKKVEQLADLPFSFRDGSCINYDGEHVLLIGGWGQEKDTWIFDGENYTKEISRTTYDHYAGGVAKYTRDGDIGVVLTAGEFEYYGTTEFYR